MLRLTNPVQPYAWGSTTAIPRLLGHEPDGGPQAELWIGAHPSLPSTADGKGLDELIAASPGEFLGSGERLGYLLKVLAAAAPLSLQAHPDAATAARRFAEEEAAGVPLDAPHRLYKDTSHKPELLFALEPFAAMAGFRSPAAARELLAGLDLPALPPDAQDLLDALLAALAGEDALREATRLLLTAPAEAVAPLVEAVATACAGSDDPSAQCVVELAASYPGDAGVLVSVLLNQVRLAPGEALFLPAGNVHAYLEGTGVELMASSDNVLRGGLTPKHVDVPELLAVLDFRELPPPLCAPEVVSDDELVFSPVPDFALTVLTVRAERVWADPLPRAVIVLEGAVELSSGAGTLELAQGQSAFVTAAEHPLTISGSGRLAAASPGTPSA
ncbi:mannose-6-phosphate isomerase, class I [Kineococcus rhizosphaerae]|uniref:mannose-6-phosphate isomerase n=1 Tax=Kineococcus rhizosphaerae TaxID=559628 RepID=A0A2T0R0A3_9ACTN|nr:mannose-6-phosphate isomerase, class I [Kineococcus rhizosphaerae]PRY12559.1 mannose-6-phosphate isomerase type 1 [Kineococcus rhizosphaerae]